jgi:Zn-dependent M28 family amino/carboxypeptidase
MPRRSVVLALWDAEEDGLLGSRYYVDHPLVPLEQTVTYVNFDILGADLLPTLRSTSFAVGSETGGSALRDIVDAAVAAQSLSVRPFRLHLRQLRSDYANSSRTAFPPFLLRLDGRLLPTPPATTCAL